MEATETQLEKDEQKFQKKLQDDQTQLDDKLDSIQVEGVYTCGTVEPLHCGSYCSSAQGLHWPSASD